MVFEIDGAYQECKPRLEDYQSTSSAVAAIDRCLHRGRIERLSIPLGSEAPHIP
jgi:hypothetical protein